VQRRELEYAASRFNSVELNASFYSLQRPALYASWRDQTPADFLFSVKGGRYITHLKKLKGVETALANFFASGVLELGQKLGPILWQFPEVLAFDERFESFFRLLPKDTRQAAALASRHDERVAPFVAPEGPVRPLRHAVEVRHRSFQSEPFVALLREHGFALVVADTAGRWPYFEDVTAPFVYLRLHGDSELYTSGYTPAAIDHWARRVRAWSQGKEPADAIRAASVRAPKATRRDAYVYFDNDAKVHAPFDAMALSSKLGL
jgi:uncharacterized protein YecE (DUF72 family)